MVRGTRGASPACGRLSATAGHAHPQESDLHWCWDRAPGDKRLLAAVAHALALRLGRGPLQASPRSRGSWGETPAGARGAVRVRGQRASDAPPPRSWPDAAAWNLPPPPEESPRCRRLPPAAGICTLQSRHPRTWRLRQSTAPPSPRDAARASVDGTCPHGAAVSRGSTALWSWQQNPRRRRPGMRKAPQASDAPEPVAGAVRPIAAEPPAQRLSVTQRPRLRCGRKAAERKRGRGWAAGRRRVGRRAADPT